MEKDWLLDEFERHRLVEPYRPVSPGWRHVGWSAFWAATAAAALIVVLIFSFSDRVEDVLLIGAGAVGALSLVSLVTAVAVALRHRRRMYGPYEAEAEEPADPSTQMGTSRPARAT